MKRFNKTTAILLAAVMLLSSLLLPANRPVPAIRGYAGGDVIPFGNTTGYNSLRASYNVGTCRTLEESPFVLVIYLDDDVSGWTEEMVYAYNADLIEPAMTFIEENAAANGTALDIQYAYYATYGHPDRPVKYNGTVENFNDGEVSRDVLDQAALALGFSSKEEMHSRMQAYSGREQIAYLLMMNKGGRSYSICAEKTSAEDTRWENLMEYCLIFTGFTDTSYDSASDTVAHETLHLFGAEDYYYPDSRKALAQQVYPTDIMLCAMSDLAYFTLDSYTAYCVGWTDTAPEVCSNPAWWG